MRVVVNELSALTMKTGIGHYTVELLRCLHEQTGQGEVESFPQGWLRQARKLGARARACLDARASSPTLPGQPPVRSWYRSCRGRLLHALRQGGQALTAFWFRKTAAQRGYQLYHEPNFIPLRCDLPTVATLHDLSVLLHPEWHPADRVAHFERNFHRGLGQCQHFLAISEFGRQEVIRNLHIRPERVTRTYMGIRPGMTPLPEDQVQRTLQELGLPRRYLLHVGTIEPRKNLLMLLRAYLGMPPYQRLRWPLLLVGGWGWNTAAIRDYLDNEARHAGVIHVGYVADEHLPAIYNGARALVFPSLYEGFGLPPVEMMACGGAVLASTAGAVVETVGARAHLIDPFNLDGWREAMIRVIEDDDWWQSLRQGVQELARPFTWDQCAADTLRVYHQQLGLRTTDHTTRRAA